MVFQKGHIAWNKGIPRSDIVKKKISEKLIGHKFNYDKLVETGFKKGNVPWNKDIKMSEEYCNNRKEDGNPNWKGGFYKKEGYVFVKQEGHPRATKWGYIGEHILVVEKSIGRYLTKEEIVHHINGEKHDNKLENLMVMNKPEHYWFHKNVDYYRRVVNDYLTSVN